MFSLSPTCKVCERLYTVATVDEFRYRWNSYKYIIEDFWIDRLKNRYSLGLNNIDSYH